jgi:hypothetical protein
MKKITSIIFSLIFFYSLAFAQKTKNQIEEAQVKQTCISFLKWYKRNSDNLKTSPVIKGFNPDTIKKDSILKVDMNAVEIYLSNFKAGGYVSAVFLNNLRAIYKSVSDTLTIHQVKDYFGPIPSLESDIVLGFGKEEILDNIRKAKIKHFLRIYNKALISLRLSYTTELIFTLTRKAKHWQIDYIGFNGDNKYNIGNQ